MGFRRLKIHVFRIGNPDAQGNDGGMKKKHVAVLLGGFSSERPVSLSSGNACADALEQEGYKVTRVDVARDVGSVLAALKPDVAFNALHGPFGEDGTIQGILEYLAIPYTHSGVLASALAMNKEQAKKVAKATGIPVAESKVLNRFAIKNKHPMKPPYVVKPVSEGSSFGVVIVKEDQSHPPQVITSSEWKYGDTVMVELPPREVERRAATSVPLVPLAAPTASVNISNERLR
jgi:D-alanine-D-alanine ligase